MYPLNIFGGRYPIGCILLIISFFFAFPTLAETTALGEIIDAKGDEQIRRSISDKWEPATTGMKLYLGNELRTGEYGKLALLFDDETQIRLHQNSYFRVENIRSKAEETSSFTLVKGALWSSAKAVFRFVTGVVRPNPIVNMNTPTATIGIRGTDWYVNVDPETGASRVILLTGKAIVNNEYGEVTILPGEEALAEKGKAPVKRVIVDLKDRPLFALEYYPKWLDALSITELSKSELLNRLKSEPQLSQLELAEIQYDLGNFSEAQDIVSNINKNPDGRLQILKSLLIARDKDYEQSFSILKQTNASTEASHTLLNQLSQVAVLAAQNNIKQANNILYSIKEKQNQQVILFKSLFAFYASDYPSTFEFAQQGNKLYPDSSQFDLVMANAYFLTDETEKMHSSIENAINKDPSNAYAWHLQGMYFENIQHDPGKAIDAYNKAIELKPSMIESINNLAAIYFQLGNYKTSERLFDSAENVSQGESLLFANKGFLYQGLDESQKADDYFNKALELDPSQIDALSGQAYQALNNGENEKAIDLFLKVIAINPATPGAHTNLAIAYYQAGRYSAAASAIDRAIQLDPNDPIAPQIGSAIAIDQADIARAIPLAQQGLEKSLKFDYYGVENIASARSGLTNIGSAYLNLGLTDWANYYAQLSFTPYLANSHTLLSNVYSPRGIRATNSALNLALMIEPTAISIPNRFFQFIREPGNFFTIGGSLGDEDGATTGSGSMSIQGFHRIPQPVSYRLDYSRSQNEGFRINSESESDTLNFSIGTRLPGRKHHISANIFATQSEAGSPGSILENDPDDMLKTSSFSGSLSYHLRLAFDNRILARIGVNKLRSEFDDGILSDRLTSILLFFGETQTRSFIQQGLYDLNAAVGAPCAPLDPCIGVGSSFAALGPLIDDPFPDFKGSSESDLTSYSLQFRHLFKIGDIDTTYGFEIIPQTSQSKIYSTNLNFTGVGTLFTNPPLVQTLYPGFTSFNDITEFDSDPFSAHLYTQARWKATEDFWIEGGVGVRRYDDDLNDAETDIDPRIGLGYRVNQHHWLRAAFQSELVLPVPSLGYLSPVATMGFVTPLTTVNNGSRIENFQMQWDAQWSNRIFTMAKYEQQFIEDWVQLFAPGSLSATLTADKARIRNIELGINIWLLERFGLAAKYLLTDSKNLSAGVNDNDLPLVPEQSFSVGLNWIHPKQITSSLGFQYVDQQFGNVANTEIIDDYWLTNFAITWQPLDRKLSVGFAVNNILDEDYDLAANFPAPGRSVVLSVQARY